MVLTLVLVGTACELEAGPTTSSAKAPYEIINPTNDAAFEADVQSTLNSYPSYVLSLLDNHTIRLECSPQQSKADGGCSGTGLFLKDSNIIYLDDSTLNRSGTSKWILTHEVAHVLQDAVRNCYVGGTHAWKLLDDLAGPEAPATKAGSWSSSGYTISMGALEVTADLFPEFVFPEFEGRVGTYAHKIGVNNGSYTFERPSNTSEVFTTIINNCL